MDRYKMFLLELVVALVFFESFTTASGNNDTLRFTARTDRHDFLKCEGIWVLFVLTNVSDRVINAPFPSYYSGDIELSLIGSNGSTIKLNQPKSVHRSTKNVQLSEIAPGDSLIGILNIADAFGGRIGRTYGTTQCHSVGKYNAVIRYIPNDTKWTIDYEVVEPATPDEMMQFAELDEINRYLRSQDISSSLKRIDGFLARFPSSGYLSEVWRQKTVLFGLREKGDRAQRILVLNDLIEKFPDEPSTNSALNELIMEQTVDQNEKLLDLLQARKGTLISLLARQKMQAGGFRKLGR